MQHSSLFLHNEPSIQRQRRPTRRRSSVHSSSSQAMISARLTRVTTHHPRPISSTSSFGSCSNRVPSCWREALAEHEDGGGGHSFGLKTGWLRAIHWPSGFTPCRKPLGQWTAMAKLYRHRDVYWQTPRTRQPSTGAACFTARVVPLEVVELLPCVGRMYKEVGCTVVSKEEPEGAQPRSEGIAGWRSIACT